MSALYMELTAGPLAAELAPLLTAGNYEAAANVLNRKDIRVDGKLTVHAVKQYISLIGLRLPIMDSSTVAAREFTVALEDFNESGFDLSNSMIKTKIISVLDALIAEPLIPEFTATHKATLLFLGTKLVSRAEQLGMQIDYILINNTMVVGV